MFRCIARPLHFGDFKLGEGAEKAEFVTALRAIASKDVDLLVVNIVNAHLAGYSVPESVALNNIADIMIKSEGRVIVVCFSTNIKLGRFFSTRVKLRTSIWSMIRRLRMLLFILQATKTEKG